MWLGTILSTLNEAIKTLSKSLFVCSLSYSLPHCDHSLNLSEHLGYQKVSQCGSNMINLVKKTCQGCSKVAKMRLSKPWFWAVSPLGGLTVITHWTSVSIWYTKKYHSVAQTWPIWSKIMPKLLKSCQNELSKTLRITLFWTTFWYISPTYMVSKCPPDTWVTSWVPKIT